ncbi:hypothetical protein J7E93_12030 [Streptomyces sp. ISL-36]|uniref:hypothetical protein n=1 Tax=Streptomyces sp. ISL-36 TaxID=2819182 RepID=UPI001BE51991|nr:hypothetical protein [Streptomyces sp. ISL-36]MBT2440824.1 hypothetical protein [Streptomyces sp. ISL-36]
MLRSSWTPGREGGRPGPVLVSVTAFRPDRITDVPGIRRAARMLAASWAELDGAHGMWLWAQPLSRRVGSVAVWRDESALHGFVAWPPHVEIVRAYRGRGSLTSLTWQTETFDPATTWARARSALKAG